jgi:hypothetical protein
MMFIDGSCHSVIKKENLIASGLFQKQADLCAHVEFGNFFDVSPGIDPAGERHSADVHAQEKWVLLGGEWIFVHP